PVSRFIYIESILSYLLLRVRPCRRFPSDARDHELITNHSDSEAKTTVAEPRPPMARPQEGGRDASVSNPVAKSRENSSARAGVVSTRQDGVSARQDCVSSCQDSASGAVYAGS